MADCTGKDSKGSGRGAGDPAIVLGLPTACALVGPTGLVEVANACWSSRLSHDGLSRPPGQNVLERLRALPGGDAAAQGLRDLLGGSRPEFVCDLCTDDWKGSWVRVLASRIGDRGAVVMLVDLTDHPKLGGASDAGLRLERIVESAMDGIITIDQTGRVVMFNAAAERIFKVAAKDALGGTLDRFLPEHVRGAHAGHVGGFSRTGVSSRSMGNLGTLTGLRADGTEFAMEASISQVKVGAGTYLTVILRDVSEKRRLESQLLQSQKMESVGRLAGGVAHDFNNLLMAIFNYLALATRRLGPDHAVTPSLLQAHKAAERAADLTRQLLTFARKQAVAPKVLSPRDVVAGLTPMLRRLIGEDVTLRALISDDIGSIRIDAGQLEQVLVNLSINARDAMPSGGGITIEARNELLDQAYCATRLDATPGEYVVISVSDTGTGMSPDVQARLFEPFFTTKPPGKGTGLGLATCHGIVTSHGGHIAVYSELDRGTRVRVCLPRVTSGGPCRADVELPQAAPGGHETVLLAEDSELVRTILTEELGRAGYRVLVAASGPEAIALAQAHVGTIDLLLTDIVMPEMSGVQLAEALGGGKAIPVIYMSGYTEETIAHHGVDRQQVPYISKPFMTDTLLHLIRRVLMDHASKT